MVGFPLAHTPGTGGKIICPAVFAYSAAMSDERVPRKTLK
jgi:hypothetical protein